MIALKTAHSIEWTKYTKKTRHMWRCEVQIRVLSWKRESDIKKPETSYNYRQLTSVRTILNALDNVCYKQVKSSTFCCSWISTCHFGYYYRKWTGAHGVMVIVIGNEHGDTSSNPRRDWLHFT